MARTVQDVIDRTSGDVLNDVANGRYTIAQIVGYVNDAVLEVRNLRPDLFVGALSTDLPLLDDPADPLPVPDSLFPAICFYVAGRAEIRDDEFAVGGRAQQLINALAQKLMRGF